MQLKRELEQFSQNEKDYADLNFLLTNLEHRYNLLYEEKQRLENEFMIRQENSIQTLALQNSDIQSLKDELLYEKNLNARLKAQLNDIQNEVEQLNENLIYERHINNELKSQLNDRKNQTFEIQRKPKEDTTGLQENYRTLMKENSVLITKIENLQSYIQQIKIRNKDSFNIEDNQRKNLNLQKQDEETKNQVEQMKYDLKMVQKKCEKFEIEKNQVEKESTQLKLQNNEIQQQNDNYKKEIEHMKNSQKNLQQNIENLMIQNEEYAAQLSMQKQELRKYLSKRVKSIQIKELS